MFSNLFRSDVGFLSNTGVDCSLCNEFSNSWSNTWIEWRWDNVFYVCAFDNVSQRTGEFLSIGDLGHFNFNIVEAIASFVDCTLAVAEDCICNTCGEQQFGDSDSSSASTAYNNVEIFDVFANNFQSVEQTCQSNDSSTILEL